MGLLGITFGIFTGGGWVPLVSPALGLVVTGVGVSAYRKLYDAFHDSLTGLPEPGFVREFPGAGDRPY
jgi:CHASE2 domain-containing sensor protein